MAASLTAVPVRHTGKQSLFTGLPKIPSNTSVALITDTPRCSRVLRRSSVVPSTTLTPTWFAQAHSAGVKVCLVSGANSTMSGYTVDPTLVDWANVTRTYQRPRNPNGGILRFTDTIGTARLNDGLFSGGATILSQSVAEEKQPLLSGLNTWTVARKLPPLAALSLTTPAPPYTYASGTIGHIEDNSALVSGRGLRWLGGSIRATVLDLTLSYVVTIYVVPIDSATLIGNTLNRIALGTITTVPGVPQSATYSAATISAAGVVRWDQFWIYAVHAGGTPPTSLASYGLLTPSDIPPPYDCPGVDSVILGGFYT